MCTARSRGHSPPPTAPCDVLREGLQECEARMLIIRALEDRAAPEAPLQPPAPGGKGNRIPTAVPQGRIAEELFRGNGWVAIALR